MKSTLRLGLLVALLAAFAYAFSSGALRGDEEPREVFLVARNMAFALQGAPERTPNPTIELRPGERVRFVLINLDPGMRHDLVMDRLEMRTPGLAHGEMAAIEFTAPARGESDYYCSFHSVLMRGRIVVR
ncbi:MAG TPA: cupredoxin domain-containing protein [Candidatus Eisenbacteria bacterium]|jgi:plastocyanin